MVDGDWRRGDDAKSHCGLFCALLLLATAGGAAAQEFRATVKGQVADTSEAALPGATVSVQNQDTNEIATATTNAEGPYTVPFLRPGLYTLTVELTGFQKYTRSGMRLEVGQVAPINVQLGVGLTETVNVSSEAPLLETSNADRGTVIDSARIAELPLQSRSPMALAVLVAGVNYNAQAIYLRPFDNGALADWSMNGGQNRNNEFLLDGAPNNANQGGNNIAYVPPAEAVQEFKVATNSYDAQYGRTAGGVVNMSLKSGTNTFHGVGYEFLRRKSLDRQLVPAERPQRRRRPTTTSISTAFSLDGPICQEQDLLHVHRREVPRGHAGAAVQHDADRRDEDRRLQRPRRRPGPPDRHLRPGHRPRRQRRLDARSVPGQQHPGRPHQPGARARSCSTTRRRTASTAGVAPWQQNLHYAEHFNKDLFWNWVGKVDHNFSPNDRTYFRWGENERNEVRNTTAIRSGPAQDGQLPLIRANRAIVGDWVHVFGGGTVFNVRGGYTYFLEWSQSDASFGFDSTRVRLAASLVVAVARARRSAACSRASSMADFVSLSRGTVAEPQQELLAPAEHLADARHAQHPQRPRRALDQRLQRQLRQRRRVPNFNQQFTRSTLNSTSVLEGNSFASFLLGAPANGEVPVNAFPTTSGSSSPRGSRTTGASATS